MNTTRDGRDDTCKNERKEERVFVNFDRFMPETLKDSAYETKRLTSVVEKTKRIEYFQVGKDDLRR